MLENENLVAQRRVRLNYFWKNALERSEKLRHNWNYCYFETFEVMTNLAGNIKGEFGVLTLC